MREHVLITGGAGFVGSHLADRLAARGHDVTLFDSLDGQVHAAGGRPAYLDPAHELVLGDIRDPAALGPLVSRADIVYHLAAAVGVGQSMYEIRRYTDVNAMGAATLLQCLVDAPHHVRKLVVASSMSVYGEGAYACAACGPVAPRPRPVEQLERQDWEVRCPRCGAPLAPLPTDEEKPLQPASIYAITKRDHEEMFLAFGKAYGVAAVALRFFNIYGSRQALTNPYTGVAAIFCGRMLAGQRPLVFEDGRQLRDFVHVSDIAAACELALRPEADGEVFNVGSGRAISINEILEILARELGWDGGADVTQRYRAGDIRHCYADIAKIHGRLGFEPRVRFETDVGELVEWVRDQSVARHADTAAELAARGLVR
jgi:dTDP-L-rhamnose 4-epimerase